MYNEMNDTFKRFIDNCIYTNLLTIDSTYHFDSNELLANILGYRRVGISYYDGIMIKVFERNFMMQYTTCDDMFICMDYDLPYFYRISSSEEYKKSYPMIYDDGKNEWITMDYIKPEYESIHMDMKEYMKNIDSDYSVSMILKSNYQRYL